jgi:large subunit ribosomal protein L25
MELTIECQQRVPGSKPNALRRSGQIPANLYGHDGNNSISLTVNSKSLEGLLKKARVDNTVITVNIPELSWTGTAVIKELQTHPWKNYPYHVSFCAVKTAA